MLMEMLADYLTCLNRKMEREISLFKKNPLLTLLVPLLAYFKVRNLGGLPPSVTQEIPFGRRPIKSA
jgi:hypothetical protein